MANTFFQVNGSDISNYFVPRDVFSQGQLWLWGFNNYGQLGDNTTVNKSSPIQTVSGGTNWKQVSCGDGHTAAIKTDGTLWIWGGNTQGELGTNNTTSRSSPVQTVSGGTNWKQVSVGSLMTHAIKTDGTLWGWGYNSFGQLGDNTTASKSSPVQTVAAGTNWKFVSSDVFTIGAIKTDGTLWTWGDNSYGALGTNDTTNRSSPVQTVAAGVNWKQLSVGGYHIAAIKTDGTLWLWGQNTDFFTGATGQLGDNTIISKSSPVQTVSGGTNWKQVSCSVAHTAAIKTDGTLWVWGSNISGNLGTNNITKYSSPVQTVSGGTNWKQVSAKSRGSSELLTGAIKTDGTLWMWGTNQYGTLGDNTITVKSSPVQTVAGGNNWKEISTNSTVGAIYNIL